MENNRLEVVEEFLKHQEIRDKALEEVRNYLQQTDKGKYLFEQYIRSMNNLSLAKARLQELSTYRVSR